MSRAASQVREKFFQDFATTSSGIGLWAPEAASGPAKLAALPDLCLTDGHVEHLPSWMETELPLPEAEETTEAVEQLRQLFHHFFGEEQEQYDAAA